MIPKRPYQRWDGSFKDLTKNCVGCNFYREIEDKKLCGWGVAFKYLVKPDKMRKCEIKNRILNNKNCYEEHSVKYLDEIIKELKNAMD